MAYVIGLLLALSVCVFATSVGMDSDRAFYPTMTIVVASHYGLFCVVGASLPTLTAESVVVAAFVLIATLGFRFDHWLVVAALFGQGIVDLVHDDLISNPGGAGLVTHVLRDL